MQIQQAPPPPVGRKQKTRQAVLDAAGELFAAQGIERTSVEEVADRAHVSVGTLYFHFGSKEALALAFIGSALDVVERLMEDVWAADTALERVQLAGDAYIQFALQFPVACRFSVTRAMQPEQRGPHDAIGRALSNRVQGILMRVAGDLKQAMDDGSIRREPIGELMIFLWSAWNGVISMMVRKDKLAVPPAMARRSLDLGRRLVLDSLKP